MNNEMETMTVKDFSGSMSTNFDDCFKGIGVDFNNSTYMSDTLLTLSGFKDESGLEKENISVHDMDHDVDFNFQYILKVPTSPAVRIDEEPLTYMNQGQSYEVLLNQMNHCALKTLYRSVLRISFHERRMQYMEKENLEYWRRARPGERLIDIDLPLSYGLRDVKIEKHLINSVEVVWDSKIPCGIFVKLHCISTEFTAKKHGGEKGIPFCFSIDTFSAENGRHLHSAASQVKVFKPKGADRKHKTDREKVDRQPDCERRSYQPAYDFTKLIDVAQISVETDCQSPAVINSNLSMPQNRKRPGTHTTKQKVRSNPCLPVTCQINSVAPLITIAPPLSAGCKPVTNQSTPFDSKGGVMFFLPNTPLLDNSNGHPQQQQQQQPITVPQTDAKVLTQRICASPENIIIETKQECSSSQSSSASDSAFSVGSSTEISIYSSSQDIVDWLHHYRFQYLIPAFQNFDGIDVLRLSRQDLVEICGLSDGVRFCNALLQRPALPKLTMFLCCKGEAVYHALYLHSLTIEELHQRIASVFQANASHISSILLSGPHGISIVVTSEVVRNISNESRFILHVIVDTERNGQYKIVLKPDAD